MSKRVTPEEIKEMNELYLIVGSYAGVAKKVGRTAPTVKRYIDPNYSEKKAKAAKPLAPVDWESFTDGRPVSRYKGKKIFWLTEKPGTKDLYILQNSLPKLGIKTDKSYLIFPSIYLGIPFEEFMKLCEESLGAEIDFPLKAMWPSIYFKDNAPTRKFIETINFLAGNSIEKI